MSGYVSANANQMITGTLDVTLIQGREMERIEAAGEIATERVPTANLFVLLNERAGSPFAEVEKRRAVAQVLDRTALNQATNSGMGELSASYALPAVPCYNQDESLLVALDPEAAAAELSGMKIRLLGFQTFGPNGAANTYIAETLRAAGAEVELENLDNATWAETGRTKPDSWDVAVFGSINASATMSGVMNLFSGTPADEGGANWTGRFDERSQEYLNAAMSEPDEDKRCEIYKESQQYALGDEVRVVPLSTLAVVAAARDGFSLRAPNKVTMNYTMRIED